MAAEVKTTCRTQESNFPSPEVNPTQSSALDDQDFLSLWASAFNASPELISILDNRHRIAAVNDAMARAMGCSAQDAKGKHCYELLHLSDRPPLACPHKAMLEDGNPQQAELYEENIDQWLYISVTPLKNAKGELLGSIHIARNITAQKRIEQALRESEERFHHLSEATMEGVLLSEGATIIAANQVLADMMGYKPGELPGRHLVDFIAPHDRERLNHYLRNRLTGVHELDCIRKDGSIFPIEAHSKAVSYKNSMVYQTAIRDLSQQKSIEQERARRERLQGVLEMAGAVCHEINQPMMALYGYMDIFSKRASREDPLTESIAKMAQQLQRIEQITQKLMRITAYKTKDYAGGDTIIDIDQAASGPTNGKDSKNG